MLLTDVLCHPSFDQLSATNDVPDAVPAEPAPVAKAVPIHSMPVEAVQSTSRIILALTAGQEASCFLSGLVSLGSSNTCTEPANGHCITATRRWVFTLAVQV